MSDRSDAVGEVVDEIVDDDETGMYGAWPDELRRAIRRAVEKGMELGPVSRAAAFAMGKEVGARDERYRIFAVLRDAGPGQFFLTETGIDQLKRRLGL